MRIIGDSELVKKEIVVQGGGQFNLYFPLAGAFLRFEPDPMPTEPFPMTVLVYRIKEQIDGQTYIYEFTGIENK